MMAKLPTEQQLKDWGECPLFDYSGAYTPVRLDDGKSCYLVPINDDRCDCTVYVAFVVGHGDKPEADGTWRFFDWAPYLWAVDRARAEAVGRYYVAHQAAERGYKLPYEVVEALNATLVGVLEECTEAGYRR